MNTHIVLITHLLPLWFLVLALFLPRLALFCMYLQHGRDNMFDQYRIVVGLVPLLFWLFLPRLFVLYLIYLDQGVSLWFVIHLVVAVMVWGGSGNYHSRRWRRRDEF
jgi:hypothetical protein